jgi:hypothetical protein
MVQVIPRWNRSWDDIQTKVFNDSVYEYTCVAPVWTPETQPLEELAKSNWWMIFREELATGSIMVAMNQDLNGSMFQTRWWYQHNVTNLGVVAWYDYDYIAP